MATSNTTQPAVRGLWIPTPSRSRRPLEIAGRLAALLLFFATLSSAPLRAQPVASHLDGARDVLENALQQALDHPELFVDRGPRRAIRAARRAAERYVADSGDLKGDLAILSRMANQVDKALMQEEGPFGSLSGPLGVAFDDAVLLYRADVQQRIDDVAADIAQLPESNQAEKADKARQKAQEKLDAERGAITFVRRTKLIAKACKKADKAAKLVEKARRKVGRHPCVDEGEPHGALSFVFVSHEGEQIGEVHDMEGVDGIWIDANSAGDPLFTVTGTIAENPFEDGTSFDPFEISLFIRNVGVGPYPKTIDVDGPLNGRPQASAFRRRDGSRFVEASNHGEGTITVTGYDPLTRTCSGFFDVVVDDFLDVPRRISGSWQLDCFVINGVDNR